MAKKGRKGKRKGRRYYSKKRKGAGRGKGPGIAVQAGGAWSAARALGGKATFDYVVGPGTLTSKASAIANVVPVNIKKTETWLPLVGGAAVHWAKSKPVFRIVLGPMDKLSKKWLHQPL